MKYDICLPNAMEGFLAPTGYANPEQISNFAVEAERLGYNALWAFDFINPTPDMGLPADQTSNWYELMTTLAYTAAVTQQIRLVAGVAVLPNRDPIILAKQIATVDQFSGGRLDLGVGLGLRPEFKSLHPRQAGVYRGELVDETLEALQLLLRPGNQPVSYAGKHVAFDNVNLNPKPRQDPLPMMTAAETPAPLTRAVRWGISPIIHAASLDERLAQFQPILDKAGKRLDEFERIAWADMRVDDDFDTAAKHYIDSVMTQFAKKFRDQNDDTVVRNNWIGTPDQIAEQLISLKRSGVERVVVMHTVADTMAEMLEQTQRFAEDVMPTVEAA